MTIPDYQSLMRPVLSLLDDGQVRRTRDLKDATADLLELTAEERAELLPRGRQRVIDSRVGWAITYLVQAGLVAKPSRGHAVITERGRDALRHNPTRIDVKVLEDYPEFVDFQNRERRPRGSAPTQAPSVGLTVPHPPADSSHSATPAELVDQAVASNQAVVRSEVLRAALALSPTGFEELVIRLLSVMGYGSAGAVERTSATGDAGIDGIISQDPLGLDRIYVQAKRYATDRAVDRPRIHEFAGALLGKQGDRGVFITTSRFTEGARLEAERINARIELIDGERLASLLLEFGVGVQPDQQVILYRLDEDFFDAL